ncbi:hypothetical protein [Rhodothalassium salexigens]|nr:hypothetical protein [Rhodothalassium salexigens]MBB4212479.1 tetratricopeptide (TPR) repeat protein [Rhodothalassium salexigens DSM 2132]
MGRPDRIGGDPWRWWGLGLALPALLLLMPGALRDPPAPTPDDPLAAAEPEATAQRLYDAGRWAAAADAGVAAATADGYGLAARAQLVAAGYGAGDETAQRRGLVLALAAAEAALARDPDHGEGNLQAAAALGYRARFDAAPSDVRAARARIDRALVAHPRNAWAHAADAAWHAEVVLGAGSLIARVFFGASRKRARAAFARAADLAPDTVAVLFSEAQLRLRFARPADETRARALLGRIATLPPRDAFDARLKDHAAQVAAAWAAGGPDAARRTLKPLLPFRGDG